jgi:MoaA/NifB/PqqE/SkfB family radical SAM enzyme
MILLANRINKHQIEEIAIEVTNKCFLNCCFCKHQKVSLGVQEEIPFELIRKLIDNIKSSLVPVVRITGGEPFLHSRIIDILKYAKTKGLRVVLNTSASLPIDRQTLRVLEKCVDMILVSIQGYDKDSERRITGTDKFFNSKLYNIRKLNSSNIKFVVLGTVISKMLIENWLRYSRLEKNLGVRYWSFFRPMVSSRNKLYSLKREDYVKFINLISNLNSKEKRFLIFGLLPFCLSPDLKNTSLALASGNYNNGYSKLVWSLRGYYKPCYFIDIKLGKTIKEALKHPYMRRLNSHNPIPYCKDCILWPICLGGSRFLAKTSYGSYFSPDPLANRGNSLFSKVQTLKS